MLIARLFLLLAIISEVAGTTSMNIAAQTGAWWGYLAMYVLIALSYYFLAKAATRISIGVAYATWEGLGILLITIVSLFYFDSALSTQELAGLMLAIVGIVMVTIGEEHPPVQQPTKATNKHCAQRRRGEKMKTLARKVH